jgi:hypothetical protein
MPGELPRNCGSIEPSFHNQESTSLYTGMMTIVSPVQSEVSTPSSTVGAIEPAPITIVSILDPHALETVTEYKPGVLTSNDGIIDPSLHR